MHAGDEREQLLTGIDPDTRRRIESAVLQLFSQQEFHRVKLIDIATVAQVSLQTIYKYYGSKETLLFTSLDSWLGELAQRMIDHLQGIENYKDRLRKVFWLMLDYFEQNPQVAQIIMSSVYLNTWRRDDTFRQPELMSIFLKVLGEGRAQGVFNDEADEKDLLDFFLGVATRKITMWLVRGRNEALADQAPRLFEMLWRAIAYDSEPARERGTMLRAAAS
jgi:AcrR family transcriptional regulator